MQVCNYFGQCKVLTNEDNARHLAKGMAKEVLVDDFCPILEYGIVRIDLPNPFNYYVEQTKQTIEEKKKRNERVD